MASNDFSEDERVALRELLDRQAITDCIHRYCRGVDRMDREATCSAYHPDGVNVGLNLGAGAGAGVPDHLHVHCLPRWMADTNFVTTVAETRVLSEPLDVTRRKLRAVWPEA